MLDVHSLRRISRQLLLFDVDLKKWENYWFRLFRVIVWLHFVALTSGYYAPDMKGHSDKIHTTSSVPMPNLGVLTTKTIAKLRTEERAKQFMIKCVTFSEQLYPEHVVHFPPHTTALVLSYAPS